MGESVAEIKKAAFTPRSVAAILLMAFFGAGFLFLTPIMARYTCYEALNAEAEALVDDAAAYNASTFFAVSGVKAGLALIEGSSVGAGFELEVGDLVQPVYDYIDLVWNVLLYSLLILGMYKLLLETGILLLGLKLAGAGFLIWAAGRIAPKRWPSFPRWGMRCVLFGGYFAYAVPIVLIGSYAGCAHYTQPIKIQYQARIEQVKMQLNEAKDEFIGLRDQVSITSPGESLDKIRTAITHAVASMTSAVWDGMFAFIYFMLVVLFELLVFPLLSAFVLYRFMQYALERILAQAVPPAVN